MKREHEVKRDRLINPGWNGDHPMFQDPTMDLILFQWMKKALRTTVLTIMSV